MVIKTKCANCGAGLAAPAEKAGARLKCPKCGSPVQIPSAAPAGSPAQAAPRRPAAPAQITSNIDLEDLPGGADLSAFDSSGNTDPFSSAMNLTAGTTLSPMGGAPLGLPQQRKGGLFGLDSWVWMIIGGVASVVVMITMLMIARSGRNSPDEETPTQVAQPAQPKERVAPPPRPVTGSGAGGASSQPLITTKKMPQPIADAYAGVVMITPFDASGAPLPHGSGFVCNEFGYIATAHHLLAKAHTARVLFNNGETFDVVGYRGIDTDRDLAIVELGSLPSTIVPARYVADEGLQPRINIYAIGHPEPNRYIIETGTATGIMTADTMPAIVRAKHRLPDKSIWIQTDAVVVGDNGGGPLVNEAGEVVGVASFSVTSAGKTTGYAAVVYYLEALLNALSPDATPLAPPGEPAKEPAKEPVKEPTETQP